VANGVRPQHIFPFGKSDLRVGIDEGLLVDPANALEGADVESILRIEIARVGRFDLARDLVIEPILFQGSNLCLRENDALAGYFFLQDAGGP